TNVDNPEQGVGINDLTLQNNVVWGWTKGLTINAGMVDGATSRNGINGLLVANNDFQNAAATPVLEHGNFYVPGYETWRNNRYNSTKADSSSTPYFRLRSSMLSLPDWQAQVEPTAADVRITYPEPSRSPASYNGTVGGSASLDA